MVRGVALLHDDVSSFLHGSGDDATTTTMTVQIRRQWAQIWPSGLGSRFRIFLISKIDF
jgi:hypothetical protein